MSRYVLYVLLQLVGPLFIITFSLTGVVWLTQSLRFVDLIINKGLSFGLFVYMTALLLPSLLSTILPIALFVAVIYVYHRLIIDSEILVLKASGVSNLRLVAPAVFMALVVMTGSYAINLHFMPSGFRAFKDLQAQIRDSFATVLLQEGVFNTPVEGLTIYVRERDRSGELHGILVHDGRDPQQTTTVMAEKGMLVSGDGWPRFVLLNGNRQEIEPDSERLTLLYFDRYVFDMGGVGGIRDNRFREPKERYLGELLWPSDVVEDRHRREFIAEAHKRIVMPLHSLGFVLIGLSVLLFGQFNRRGQNRRLMIAVGLAVVFESVSVGLTSVIAELPVMAPLLYGVVLFAIGASCYVLASDRNWRFGKTAPASG